MEKWCQVPFPSRWTRQERYLTPFPPTGLSTNGDKPDAAVGQGWKESRTRINAAHCSAFNRAEGRDELPPPTPSDLEQALN
jgi:hypothetical protein